MRSPLTTRRRVTAGLVAASLLLAACGGGDDGTADGSSEAPPPADASTAPADAGADTNQTAPPAAGSGIVDLVGADVLPASDTDANPLPNVVVDDINTGRKVNFRNLVPQEKPILLWMWAPN